MRNLRDCIHKQEARDYALFLFLHICGPGRKDANEHFTQSGCT